jgi:hypothetical protein
MLRPRRDPFTLLGFHRVLIVTAALAAFGYGVRAIVRAGEGSSAWEAVVAWGLAGALVVYFWNIRHRR